jgi:hypothetical protein
LRLREELRRVCRNCSVRRFESVSVLRRRTRRAVRGAKRASLSRFETRAYRGSEQDEQQGSRGSSPRLVWATKTPEQSHDPAGQSVSWLRPKTPKWRTEWGSMISREAEREVSIGRGARQSCAQLKNQANPPMNGRLSCCGYESLRSASAASPASPQSRTHDPACELPGEDPRWPFGPKRE